MGGAGGSSGRSLGLDALRRRIAANRAGTPVAAPVWTSVQPEVLRVIFAAYARDEAPVLVQASAAMVNRSGGLSGMTPLGFRNFVEILASGEGVDPVRLVLLADRLGPGLWADQPADIAMRLAEAEVAAFVEAGFDLLHLNATAPCADDVDLTDGLVASRVAELCAAAESAAGGRKLGYIIGCEPPPEGGLPLGHPPPLPATPDDMQRCFERHEAAFAARGIAAALERILAVAVASGADFDNDTIYPFSAVALGALPDTILDIPDATFLAPSVDYQSASALQGLAAAHFGLIGVGPELGFAFREAVVAMAEIDARLLPGPPSDVLETLAAEMDDDPAGWDAYVEPDETEAVSRLFGFADRARLYWGMPAVAAALQRLYARIDTTPLPYGLVSQYAPQRLAGADDPRPLSDRIITDHVGPVVMRFRHAAGTS